MTRITHLVVDDLVSSDFLTYHTSNAILGHIFVSVKICRSPLICMIVPNYTLSWWFDFILSWFFGGAFLESFRQAHTFWCCHDSWMELSLVHRLPYHHFSGVHVRSLIHPHWVILELSGQTGCFSCYTGAYFPIFAVEMIVFSQTYYSLHYWDEVYFFALLVIVSVIGRDEPLEEHDVLGFDCPAIHDFSVDFCVEVALVTPTDYSLETPHWIIHLRWRWTPPTEHFELEVSDLLWHFIRPCDLVR